MAKIKKLKILSFAIFQALLVSFLGLLAGILYSFGGIIVDLLTIGLNWGTVMAFGALVGMPIVFAAIGFVAGVLEAVLYNLFARWFGGIDLEFERLT